MKISWKWIVIIGLLLAILLAGGNLYMRHSEKPVPDNPSKIQVENDALQGELYRLRQNRDQQDLRMKYLLNPEFDRYLAWGKDSSFVWLQYRQRDSAWYVEVSAIQEYADEQYYRLYISDSETPNNLDYVGNFTRIADTAGLQKVGNAARKKWAFITSGITEGVEPEEMESEILYRSELVQ